MRMSSLWFRTDLANQQEIAAKFDRLSLQGWGLSNRTLNALLSYNFKMTIGEVIRIGENLVAITGLGEAGIKEISTKVSQLFTETLKNSKTPLPIDPSVIISNSEAFKEPLPKLLPQSMQNFLLDYLHLDEKTHEALVKAGIT